MDIGECMLDNYSHGTVNRRGCSGWSTSVYIVSKHTVVKHLKEDGHTLVTVIKLAQNKCILLLKNASHHYNMKVGLNLKHILLSNEFLSR